MKNYIGRIIILVNDYEAHQTFMKEISVLNEFTMSLQTLGKDFYKLALMNRTLQHFGSSKRMEKARKIMSESKPMDNQLLLFTHPLLMNCMTKLLATVSW